jgi:protoporphyrinogen IX oxidase
MTYLVVKAAHLLAMVIWLSGMIVVPLLLSRRSRQPVPTAEAEALRRAFARVCTPSMIAVWILGLTLAQMSGWFSEGWVMAKIGLVLVLSGLHGALVGQLRRVAAGDPVPAFAANAHWAVLGLLTAIILLAVLRPF